MAERWILARPRNHQFFSLAELNAQIRTLLEALNHRAFKKLSGSRRSHYEDIDRPALKALPAEPYIYAECSVVQLFEQNADLGVQFSQ